LFGAGAFGGVGCGYDREVHGEYVAGFSELNWRFSSSCGGFEWAPIRARVGTASSPPPELVELTGGA
jgi:hypothetical protein